VTDWAKKVALIEHLDRRRVALDQVLWQAPAIIVAAQAFLLPVLARQDIGIPARALILSAGVWASLTAIVGLRRGRSQELFFNEEIRGLLRRAGVDVPLWPKFHRVPMYRLWQTTLALFIVADALAFACNLG
jgi:hypothetical protein